jgi:hypothetical protein
MAILTRIRLWVLLAGTLLCTGGGEAQESIEKEVRAAFLYNFTKFISWPEEALPDDHFRVCVIGDDELAAALDPLIAGETAHGRPILRVPMTTLDTVHRCQMLYLSAREGERGRRLLSTARAAHVLTVGEEAIFLDRGGAIRFLLEQNRVKFDISLPALERAGLTASSKLLRVARQIVGLRLP